MRFGKIKYLNLAQFDVFIKSYPAPSGFKLFINSHQSYPSKLNEDFFLGHIDAGFISSIAAYPSYLKGQITETGIIAKKEVWSVLCIPKPTNKSDFESATSNALCKILGIQGEVLIGDKALKYHFSKKNAIDLAQEWQKKEKLPFVFGLFSFRKNHSFYKNISKHFNSRPIKIPHYILMKYSKDLQIPISYIKDYLKRIHYKIGPKETLSLKRFYRHLYLQKIKKCSRTEFYRTSYLSKTQLSNIHSQHHTKNASK